jgi:hypothetical protein
MWGPRFSHAETACVPPQCNCAVPECDKSLNAARL